MRPGTFEPPVGRGGRERPGRPAWAELALLGVTVLVAGCTSGGGRRATADPAFQVPASIQAQCQSGPGVCEQAVPAWLRSRPVRFPVLRRGARCPTTSGAPLTLPNAGGTAVGHGPVRVLIPQAGDIAHGLVTLAASDVTGWYGIKTLWIVSPGYRGWVLVRGRRLDRPGPIALLAEAGIGPLLVPPNGGPNDAGGWREQPSGTYVKAAGCYAFQVDGTSFTDDIVVQGVLPGAR